MPPPCEALVILEKSRPAADADDVLITGIKSATTRAAARDPLVIFENFTQFLLVVSGMCLSHTSIYLAVHVLTASDLEFCTYVDLH